MTKRRLEMTHDEATAVLNSLTAFPVWPITRDLVIEATDVKQRFQISYWDAAILAAAKQMGCTAIYSEDFDHTRQYDSIKFVDSFRE